MGSFIDGVIVDGIASALVCDKREKGAILEPSISLIPKKSVLVEINKSSMSNASSSKSGYR